MKLLPRLFSLVLLSLAPPLLAAPSPLSQQASQEASKLAPELLPLAIYIGTWESEFDMGGNTVTDVSRWEVALQGKALRNRHSINDGFYGGESFVVWDARAERLVFFYFTTGGFYTSGTISVQADGSFTAEEAVTGSAQGVTAVRSTSRRVEDTLIVESQFKKEGAWTPRETRTYQPSEKTPVID